MAKEGKYFSVLVKQETLLTKLYYSNDSSIKIVWRSLGGAGEEVNVAYKIKGKHVPAFPSTPCLL